MVSFSWVVTQALKKIGRHNKMAGPWEKYTQSAPDQSSSPQDGPWAKYQSNDFDPDAAVQGFGSFATAGYLPELTGAIGKLLPDPTADVDAKLKAQGTKISQSNFQGMTTDDSRAMQKNMAADSPYSYYGGGAAGAIASAPAFGAALKGIGIAKDIAPIAEFASDASTMTKMGAYATNLGNRIIQSAKEGAALGFASNPNTEQGEDGVNLGKRVFNAGTTGVISGAIPPAVDAAKGVFNTGKAATKWGATKLLSSLGGVKPDVIQEYTGFSDRINAAPGPEALKQVSDDFVGKLSADVDAKKLTVDQAQDAFKGFQSDVKDAYKTAAYDARDGVTSAQQTLKDAHNTRIQQLSGDVYDSVNQLKSDIQKGSGQALKTLDNSDAMIDLAPTYSTIDSTIDKLKKSGTDDSLAIADKLQSYKSRVMINNWANIPAPDAKKLIQGLDQVTTYSPMAGAFDKAKNAAFKGVRGSLDQTLKKTVPEYAQAMEPVAQDADLLDRVSGFADKQTAVGNLQRINAPNQLENRGALQELGQKYGADFVGAADPKNLPEQAILNKAQATQDALRPDRVASKIDQTVASSRQKGALDAAEAGLDQAQQNLAPFKSLAPNNAGQTQAQQKLMQLGKGKNIELEDMFGKLGKLTDTDFVQAMHDQNILGAFQKGATNGSRNTLMGAIVGFLFGGVPGMAGGGAAGRAVDQWGPAVTKKILDGAIQVSKSPTLATISQLSLPEPIKQNMAIELENYIAQTRPMGGRPPGRFAPSGKPPSRNTASDEPEYAGEARWASQGIQKLGIQDPAMVSKLLGDPKGKQLLIQASDLSPGSKAMKNIQNQIQKGWGQ